VSFLDTLKYAYAMQPEHFITSDYSKGAMAGHQSLVTHVYGWSLSGAMELK